MQHHRRGLIQAAQPLLLGGKAGEQAKDGTAAFQSPRGHDRQQAEHFTLGLAQHPRLAIDHAQGADTTAVGEADRGTGIEANVRLAGNQGIVGEARVARGVGDLEDLVAEHGMGTERHITRGFGDARKAHIGLEPLPLGIDQADERDRHPTDCRCRAHQRIEFRLRPGVEHLQGMQRRQSSGLVIALFRSRHRAHPGQAIASPEQHRGMFDTELISTARSDCAIIDVLTAFSNTYFTGYHLSSAITAIPDRETSRRTAARSDGRSRLLRRSPRLWNTS